MIRGNDEVSRHSTDSPHPPSKELEAAAIRRAKINSIREARNNIDADDGVAPKTSTPNHSHKVVLDISCDSNKSGSGQPAENPGVWSAPMKTKKVISMGQWKNRLTM